MRAKRADYISLALTLGLTPTEVMRDLTPGELQDLCEHKRRKDNDNE